jgi:SAM-dependent methyltransferase
MTAAHRCPGCGSDQVSVFYDLAGVPVHSVTLVPTRDQALAFPRGDIALGACRDCRFIYNTAFDPERLSYHAEYESTQAYSTTFNAFHTDLAQRLIERYDLHGKDLIEIGCGHGEFLTLLTDLGDNYGTGFDPAYRPERAGNPRTTFVKDYYSQAYARYRGDFLCCKMTLEHIQDTAGFVATVRDALGADTDTIVFFQVPNAARILAQGAFWDIYYEHCSYFTAPSLQHLFQQAGFTVIETTTAYDDQYLMVEARPARADPESKLPEHSRSDAAIASFVETVSQAIASWRQKLCAMREAGRRVVVWGGGSKAVAFLTTLGVSGAIDYAVDINPHKHGTFLAGTGQEVVAPAFLKAYRPDAVIAMNPVYCEEIKKSLATMGVAAELFTLS